MLPDTFLGLLGSAFVLSLTWALLISEFPNARVWRRQREFFLDLAQDFGLSLERETCTTRGELGGLVFSAGIRTKRGFRNTDIRLWGRLELEGCPEGLEITEVSLLSGWARTMGAEDLILDDPEFDAVFRVTGSTDIEAVRAFLTPSLRQALLKTLPLLPQGRLADGAILSEKFFATPLIMRHYFRPFLERFRIFSQILEEQQARVSCGTVEKKLKKFAVTNLLFCLPMLWQSVHAFKGHESREALVIQFGLLSLVVLNLFVFRANQGARVLLQGVYAFLSLATASVIVIGFLEFSELLSLGIFRLGEDNSASFFFINGAALIIFWGSRHYLKILHSRAKLVS